MPQKPGFCNCIETTACASLPPVISSVDSQQTSASTNRVGSISECRIVDDHGFAAIDWTVPPPGSLRRPLDETGTIALLALDMLEDLEQLSSAYAGVLPAPLEMRIGIHCGDAVGGIVGWARPR